MKKKKCTVLSKLLEEGWFENEKEALAWVMSRNVLVDNQLVVNLNEKVPADGEIRIKEYYKRKYVNKGGLKLERALEEFNIDVNNKVGLDCGASTGGFTDCLIQHGARLVYAVDVGFGQLSGKLLNDEKVINMEKTNLSDEILLKLDPKPEVISLDLSYLSLEKAVPISKKILGGEGVIICLVKPIYEVESAEIRRSGEINDYHILRDILMNLCNKFRKEYEIIGITNSPVTGNNGTLEYFIGLSCQKQYGDCDILQEIDEALNNSFELSNFKKGVTDNRFKSDK